MSAEPDRLIQERRRLEAVYAKREREGIEAVSNSLFTPEIFFLEQEMQRAILQALKRMGINSIAAGQRDLLEVGCGRGRWVRWFLDCGFRRPTGVDLIESHIKEAASLSRAANWIRADVTCLPLPSESFDIIFTSRMFSSILDVETRRQGAAELRRVLRPGGSILWVDLCHPAKDPRVEQPGSWVHPLTRDEVRTLFPGAEFSWTRFGIDPVWSGRLTSLANRGLFRSLVHQVPFMKKRIAWPRIPMARFPYFWMQALASLGFGRVYDLSVVRWHVRADA